MPKAKRSKPAWNEEIEETPDITEEMNELDREAYEARKERREDLRWLAEDPPNFFTCPNDNAVLKLRGIFKYMHSENRLASGEHWECPDCGFTKWRYLPLTVIPAEFPDGFPF